MNEKQDPNATRFQFGDLNPVTELANIAKHHIVTSICAGGSQVYPTGPCDHCGSTDPANRCLRQEAQTQGTIGDPLHAGE